MKYITFSEETSKTEAIKIAFGKDGYADHRVNPSLVKFTKDILNNTK